MGYGEYRVVGCDGRVIESMDGLSAAEKAMITPSGRFDPEAGADRREQ